MARILKVDSITGVTTAGSISVTGEGNSTTTNLQQGLAKAWNRFGGTNVPTLQDSFNNSTATDNGTGDYTFSFTSVMSNADYSPVCQSGRGTATSGVDSRVSTPDQITASNFVYNMYAVNSSGKGTYIDDGIGLTVVHGDLA